MVNTYGQTACPKCGALNSMYRELAVIKHIATWNRVKCYNCKHDYLHTDKLNNVEETEAERVRREGRD